MTNSDCTGYDVVIVGAGWSGLLSAKYCLHAGLSTLLLEARETLGGVWAFTPRRGRGGVMRSTQTTSSRCITEMSDYPMPATYPDFPSHEQIKAYLLDYADHFGVLKRLKCGTTVEKIRRTPVGWTLLCSRGFQVECKNLILSSGVHQAPNDLSKTVPFASFSGPVIHSAAIKEIDEKYAGKTFVLWGGGETASDVAYGLARVAERTYWCIPNGQWFVPKVVDRWVPFPSDHRKVVDHTSSRIRLLLSPTHGFSPFIYQYLEWSLGFNGHGQEAWRTTAPYNRAFLNKSSEALQYIKEGRIVPQRDIARCEGSTVHFTDGTAVDADAILLCSGYTIQFPAFDPPESAPGGDQQRWYKYLFAEPNLAMVGFARPIFGSIPGLAELQARLVAKVFSGKGHLPDAVERQRLSAVDADRWNHHFRFTSKRLSGLVDHFQYSDELARLIGCRPRFGRLFLRSPRKWWIAVSSPWNGCQYWLNDYNHHDRIFSTLSRYRDNQISEVYSFIFLAPILPLIGLISRIRVTLLRGRYGAPATQTRRTSL